MKIEELHKLVLAKGLPIPEGRGRNGRITRDDYIDALAHAHLNAHPELNDWGMQMRMKLGYVALPYRYTDLSEAEQQRVLTSVDWCAEEKYDGVRCVMFYHVNHGLFAYGRNRSKVDFLPQSFTDKVLIHGEPINTPDVVHLFEDWHYNSFMLDGELVPVDPESYIETLDGTFVNGLQAVTTILSTEDEERRRQYYEQCPLEYRVFDYIRIRKIADKTREPRLQDEVCVDMDGYHRYSLLQSFVFSISNDFFKLGTRRINDKKEFFDECLKAGKEGIVLKRVDAAYVPSLNGTRSKHCWIKMKRTVGMAINSDIDAYISGWFNTPEWSKRGLIGGVELSAIVNGEPKVIANVATMPDEWRQRFTLHTPDPEDCELVIDFDKQYLGSVFVVDGQDWSHRNQLLMHAHVDWERGRRIDKSDVDCTLTLEHTEGEEF